jgi:hypothetical protein
MSSPSWRSLLSGFLGWIRATGEKVPERRPQQLPFTDQSVPPAVASNPNLHAFTFAELSAATGGFASGHKIGEGRFGAVYRAHSRTASGRGSRRRPSPSSGGWSTTTSRSCWYALPAIDFIFMRSCNWPAGQLINLLP